MSKTNVFFRAPVYLALGLSLSSIVISLNILSKTTLLMDGLTKNIIRLSANSYFIGCMTEHKDKNQENLNSCKQKSNNFIEPIENISKQAR